MMKDIDGAVKQMQKEQEKAVQEQKREMQKLRQEVNATRGETVRDLRKSKTGSMKEQNIEARTEGWKWILKNTAAGGGTDEQMMETFWDKYDKDKNGSLSKKEIKRILMDVSKAKGEQLEEELPKMIKKLKQKEDPLGMNQAMIHMMEGEAKSKMALFAARAEGNIAKEELDL